MNKTEFTWSKWDAEAGYPGSSDCIIMKTSKWYDKPCDSSYMSICQQPPSPINCVMSEWSPWSASEGDCQFSSRRVAEKEKLGGTCDETLSRINCHLSTISTRTMDQDQDPSLTTIDTILLSLVIVSLLISVHTFVMVYIIAKKFKKTMAALSPSKMVETSRARRAESYEVYDNEELDEVVKVPPVVASKSENEQTETTTTKAEEGVYYSDNVDVYYS